eukprot:scaffold302862_cov22-Prasinocladus_malaysianus.AAC.1
MAAIHIKSGNMSSRMHNNGHAAASPPTLSGGKNNINFTVRSEKKKILLIGCSGNEQAIRHSYNLRQVALINANHCSDIKYT